MNRWRWVLQKARVAVDGMRSHTWIALGAIVVLATLVTGSAMLRLIATPPRHVGRAVALGPYGLPGIWIKLVYPTTVDDTNVADNAAIVTVYAWADSPDAVRSFRLLLPPSDDALTFVDRDGVHVPASVSVVPGYPDQRPHDLYVAHGQTQFGSRLFFPYTVALTPAISFGDTVTSVPELDFRVRIVGPWERGLRRFTEGLASALTPYLLLACVVLAAAWLWQRSSKQRQLRQEKRLAEMYVRLREQVKLDQWSEARNSIEAIRSVRPRFRDIEQIESVVSSAETAGWRREQLYGVGVNAYKARQWPEAVHALQSVEKEAPYFREVRFLCRTAALYADLHSRDRSVRLRAAQELGDVADLLDMMPLLNALGDRSSDVADAAEASFRRIGLQAFDTLLAGLAKTGNDERSQQLRERSYRLLETFGQSARELLVGALRSSNPRITKAAARLLMRLGARDEVAKSLLWIAPAHEDGIVDVLVEEGVASIAPLVQTLLDCPPEREPLVASALGRLGPDQGVERHVRDVIRATRDRERTAPLRRFLENPMDTQSRATHLSREPTEHAAQGGSSHLLPTGDGPHDGDTKESPAVERGPERRQLPKKSADEEERRGWWPLRILTGKRS